MTDVDEQIEELSLLTEGSREHLTPRQQQDYRQQREACCRWLLTFGKDPERAEGYAFQTVNTRGYRMDQFYRWLWGHEGGYTANIRHEHADAWMQRLAQADHSNAHKNNCQKALQMLFKWRHHEHGLAEWEPDFKFKQEHTLQPREYLTRDERSAIREASLEYGSVPTYSNLTPGERDRWKAHLAQRFEKPKSEVTPDDWKRANSWKIPSLVAVSLDTGLRPIEVERAKTQWVDVENSLLRIPKEDSSKNRDNWIVGIQDRTAATLDRWLDQRECYRQYEDTDALWLTRNGNPFGGRALRYLLDQLCNIADIPTADRKISWYAIRHSVGTYMTREEDLAAAQAQLRHKSVQTTMRYDQAPVEDRREALDRMG